MPLPVRKPAARRAALRLELLEARAVPAAAVGVNFSGGSGNTFAPPDSDGAIGPANYVQFINGRFAVYSKTGSLVSAKSDRAFWNAALAHSGQSGVTDVSDPRILYDPLSDRWFASQITIDVDVGNLVLVGRSDTNNPAGSWSAAKYLAVDSNTFGDFDTLGLDANAVYVGTVNFDSTNSAPAGDTITSIPKADLLASIPSVANRTMNTTTGFQEGEVLAGVTNFASNPTHGSILGGDAYMAGRVRRTWVTGAGGPNATFGPTDSILVQAANNPTQAHQPDGTAQIDPLDNRFGSTVYQVGDLILAVRSFLDQLSGFDAVRLTVISDSRGQVVTEATWRRTGFDYLDPSVAMNAFGDIVIGFTRSGVALGSGATDGRLGAYAVTAFLDPNNPAAGVQFGSEFKLKAGSTTGYHMFGGPFERWGDFSATSVDPTDPTSFWTTQEYAVAPGTWGTRISQVVVSPRVTGVSSTVANGTYGFGAVIPITVTFNAPVVVTGTPQLFLAAGIDAVGTYTSGSGTNTLTFTYTVRHSDVSADLDYVSSSALVLNGATIKLKSSKVSLDAILTLPNPGDPGSLGANKDIVIDTRPKVTGGVTSPLPNGTYHTTAVIPITVTFNTAVDVVGTPLLQLNAGAVATASYASGSGTNVLTFNYTVQDGQQSFDLDYSSSAALVTNGGSIQDHLGGLAADLTLPNPGAAGSLGANKKIVIDGLSPVVVGVTSSLANGAYGFGQVIPITVTFNKTVDVTGTPELALNSGGTADYTGGTTTSTLSFSYTVGAGDFVADLDAASATALTLNGGTITDPLTGLDAYLAVPVAPAANSLAGSKNISVDARPAELQDVTSTEPDGSYAAGTVIPITITFTKPVDVTGTPLLALNSGGTATYTGGNGTFTALTFTYTVQAGENAADLDAASATALTLNGGTILDHLFGTPVPLDVPFGAANPNSLAAHKDLVIDTTAPSVVDYRVVFGSNSYSLNGSARFDLPWRITSIQVVFDEPITAGAASSLTGLAADRLTGLGTKTLTWRLTTPLVLGSPATALAASGPSALTDRAGNPIRPFSQGFKVLWGDFDDNGVVDGRDEAAIRGHQAGPYQPGSAGYNLFADLSGDGIVNLVDVGIARSRNGAHL
jgi:hypothetical protein